MSTHPNSITTRPALAPTASIALVHKLSKACSTCVASANAVAFSWRTTT